MKKKTLIVSARHADRPCPMYPRKLVRFYDHESGERRDRSCIYADEQIEVANIRFYRRRIIKGDLVEVKAAKPSRETKPKTEPKKLKSEASE